MPKQRNREEVVNTQLAVLISKLGVTADAETIHLHGRHRPDVLFQLRGLRTASKASLPTYRTLNRLSWTTPVSVSGPGLPILPQQRFIPSNFAP